MSQFIVELWESVFTPGPTPTLLIAANATFGALQIVLFALLIGTYSIHFVVLSVLCAGLWWSINWFAAEVIIAQRLQKQQEEAAAKAAGEEVDGGSDTEVEEGKEKGESSVVVGGGEAVAPVEALEVKGEVKHRGEAPGTQSSTEDEWEKVSESGKDK